MAEEKEVKVEKKATTKKAVAPKKEVAEKKATPKKEVAPKATPKKVEKAEKPAEEIKVERRAKSSKKGIPNSYIATGRRKDAVARVRLIPGTGKITINKRDINDYFMLETLKLIVRQPLVLTGTDKKYDIIVNVFGGGYTGQTGAIRQGIAKALVKESETYKPELKKAGFLSRDSRMKERKKYGLKKARKAPQFSKR